MKKSIGPHTAATDLNQLRRGHSYRIATASGTVHEGEYLGIEVVWGDWCLLMKCSDETASIPTFQVASVDVPLQAA